MSALLEITQNYFDGNLTLAGLGEPVMTRAAGTVIHLRGLRKSYGELEAVRGVEAARRQKSNG